MSARPNNAELLGLVAPFLLWGLAFVVLYAGHGLVCGLGLDAGGGAGGVRAALSALLIFFLAAHGWLAWWFWKRWRSGDTPPLRFIRLVSFILAVGAATTTAWTGFPVLVLNICT